ncbi:MAG: DUF1573 domain-containing protein [Candidatus Zixiibacteriota bacterium]|nr:MAG: DUF1573 domain-containing protein [candidate division Zixibacteria bacterium]
MKQFSVLLLIILFSISFSSAQEEQVDDGKKEIVVNPASKARIKFLEDYFDFGSIPLNSVVVHDFPIKNEGTDTLVITAVKPTCGCTTAPLESDKIAPGEVTNLHVQLNTKKLHGLVRKFINIECSDPISPYLRISFKAVINDPKQVMIPVPNIADFGNVLKGEGKTVAVELQNGASDDLSLTMLSLPDENVVTVKPGKTALKAGEATEIMFDLSDKVGAGPIISSVSIEAEGKPGTRISIPISGTVVE